MQKAELYGWAVLLTGVLLTAGCSEKEAPPPQEVTLEELNASLAQLKEAGRRYPASVYELTNLPSLQGKVFPALPDGQHFAIDPDKNQVVIQIDHLPDLTNSFQQ